MKCNAKIGIGVRDVDGETSEYEIREGGEIDMLSTTEDNEFGLGGAELYTCFSSPGRKEG
jgi:hypothetical protein